MATKKQKNGNVKLLACLVDEDDEYESEYRLLVDGTVVKYVTTAPGSFIDALEQRAFEPLFLGNLLPALPEGDWNSGCVARDADADAPAFTQTETVQLDAVAELWHPSQFNELSFTQLTRVRQRVSASTSPELQQSAPALVKLAVWPWEIPFVENETAVYERIENCGVGPKFLGHVTEGECGRVVGFATEWLEGARAAGPADIEGCRKALGKLHGLGILMGDINKHNFLVRDGHDVVLVDFEVAKPDCSPEELKEEMDSLQSSLEDTSFRGGVEPVVE